MTYLQAVEDHYDFLEDCYNSGGYDPEPDPDEEIVAGYDFSDFATHRKLVLHLAAVNSLLVDCEEECGLSLIGTRADHDSFEVALQKAGIDYQQIV